MKSPFCFAVVLAALLTAPRSASGQAPATPDVPPVPETPAVAPVDTTTGQMHITRHRLSVKVEDNRSADSLEKAIAKLEADLEGLNADSNQAEIARIQRRIALLQKRLSQTNLSIQLEGEPGYGLADIDLPKVGATTTPIDPDAIVRVGLPPELRTWKRRKGDRIGFFDPVFVESSERIEGNVVGILSNVHVGGYVEHEAVSIGGDIFIDGTVDGDVIAPLGHVYLSATARINGDVVAAHVFADDGSAIEGKVEETSLPRIPGLTGRGGLSGLSAFLALIFLTIALIGILLGFLALGVAPRHVAAIEQRLRDAPVGSFIGGFALQLLAFPAWVLLVVTIIGIPVALLALPLLMLAALVLGFAAFAVVFGRALLRRGPDGSTPWLPFLTGAVLLHLPLVIGLVVSRPRSGWTAIFSSVMVFLGIAILYLTSTTGFGAALLTRLGTRTAKAPRSAARTQPIDMPPPPGAPNRSPMPAPPGPATDAT
jgi:hypothetical protein